MKYIVAALFCLSLSMANSAYALDRDCEDFRTWESAQQSYKLSGASDPDNLDRDRDGVACEVLQIVGQWRLKSICKGRDLEANVEVKHLGFLRFSAFIENNHGEYAKSSIRYSQAKEQFTVVSKWDNGSTIEARVKVSQDGNVLRGRDALGCEFIAYRK
ncbi:MAG: excalibur calcium-binding domain-containing protein [Tateyamaria sp.]|uniref:excalibur calcium-binding domain-containing protein n=1 Tax=Tateyamaria sp. TaxID=1929288 RepID=UPI00329AE71E